MVAIVWVMETLVYLKRMTVLLFQFNCHSCLSKAKIFTDSMVNDMHQKYIMYLINPISKRKIELEFRAYSPIGIIEENEGLLNCLTEYPRVSLVFKNGSQFKLIKDFTSN